MKLVSVNELLNGLSNSEREIHDKVRASVDDENMLLSAIDKASGYSFQGCVRLMGTVRHTGVWNLELYRGLPNS